MEKGKRSRVREWKGGRERWEWGETMRERREEWRKRGKRKKNKEREWKGDGKERN